MYTTVEIVRYFHAGETHVPTAANVRFLDWGVTIMEIILHALA